MKTEPLTTATGPEHARRKAAYHNSFTAEYRKQNAVSLDATARWDQFITAFAAAMGCSRDRAIDLWNEATRHELSFDKTTTIMMGKTGGRTLGVLFRDVREKSLKFTIVSPDGAMAEDLSVKEDGTLNIRVRRATAEDMDGITKRARRMAEIERGIGRLISNLGRV